MAEAMRRFCVTARMRSPKGVARSTAWSAAKTARVNTTIHRRPLVISSPPRWNEPVMKAGAETGRLSGPKAVRTACCSTSDTPQVASRVSSGRPYRNRITVRSMATPIAPATRNAAGTARGSDSSDRPGAWAARAPCSTKVV